MPKRKRDDIADLNEWQEHQYNTGYWINKLQPGFPPKRSKGYFIFGLIHVIFFAPAFTFMLIDITFNSRPSNHLIATIILGAFSLLMVAFTIRMRPLKRDKVRTQAELDEIRRKENKEKKKDLPKRRKDYK